MSLICCKDFMSSSYLSAKEMWKRPFWKGLEEEIMETQQPIMEFQWFQWAEKMSKKGQNPSHPNQVAHLLLKCTLIILRGMVLKDLTINHLCRMLELRSFKKHLGRFWPNVTYCKGQGNVQKERETSNIIQYHFKKK